MIKVSVIIPVYNAEKYLRQCLDSVLSQSLKEIEIICVDDGSADKSRDILREYATADERLKIMTQENRGPGAARNSGMEAAAGRYIMFLDADDWFEPDMLSDLYETAERNSADITVCKAERFDNRTGKTLDSAWMLKEEYLPGEAFSPEEIAEHLFQFTYGQVWDKLFYRKFLVEKELRFPEMWAAEDTAFAYKGLLQAERICVLPEVKVHYRVNVNGSVSNSFVKHPDAPFKAFELAYVFLKDSGLYERFERSFLNWAMEYLVWQVCNMPDKKIRRNYYDELNSKLNQELKLGSCPAACFENREAYLKFLLTKYMPFPLFSALIDIYGRVKKVVNN